MSDPVESILFITTETHIYQIPPLRSNAGHKASSWDVDKPFWTGTLKVVEVESGDGKVGCELRLSDTNTGELFAIAPYSTDGHGVDAVQDSSRFFAIRVVDGKRQATLGMGFQDRNVAFEFNIALQDFRKHTQPSDPVQKKDFSLKDGQKIHVNLSHSAVTTPTRPKNDSDSSASTAIPVLAPPPPPTTQRSAASSTSESRSDPFDDDFGDFVE